MGLRAYNFIKGFGITNPTWDHKLNSLGNDWINFLRNKNPGILKALEIK